MSAYNRDGLSVDAYLVRIVTALVRQAGGELRVKGELVDQVGEPTALIKEWDSKTQELVLRAGMGSFVEVFKVIPERQPQAQTTVAAGREVDPLSKIFHDGPDGKEAKRTGSTLDDDEKLKDLETKLRKRRVASMLADELSRRRTAPPNQGG